MTKYRIAQCQPGGRIQAIKVGHLVDSGMESRGEDCGMLDGEGGIWMDDFTCVQCTTVQSYICRNVDLVQAWWWWASH